MNSKSSNQKELQQVSTVRIFEQAVVQMRGMIEDGTWAHGQKLPTELELSQYLNVSRSSVREALRVLEAEGLVETKRGSGTFVSNTPDKHRMRSEIARWLEQREESLEQVLQVRASVEGLAASLAALNATDLQISEIRNIYEEQLRTINQISDEDDKIQQLARLDAAFHISISVASGNDIAHEIISHIIPAFIEGNKAMLYLSTRYPLLTDEHSKILIALESHQPEIAEKAMRKHIHRVLSDMSSLKKI